MLCFLPQQVKLIVQNALRLYSQDRTGLVDYALESGGMEKLMSTLLPVYSRAFLACRDKQAGCSVPQLCVPMCLLHNERSGIKEQKLRLHCPLSYRAVFWPIWKRHFHGLVAQYLKEHFTLTPKMDIHSNRKMLFDIGDVILLTRLHLCHKQEPLVN